MKFRIFSSFLVILSGILFIADQFVDILGITIHNTYGFNSTANFVFFIGTWIGILMLIFASRLKPFLICYSLPIYNVLLSMYWVFFSKQYDNKNYFNGYVFICTVLLIFAIAVISVKAKTYFEHKEILLAKDRLLENLLDLTILKTKKDIENSKADE